MRILANLLFHALFFGLALLALQWTSLVPVRYAPVLELLPYGLAATSILLAVRFNRSRIMYGALLLVAAYGCLHVWAPGLNKIQIGLLVNAVMLFLPLNIVLISIYTERGIFTPAGTARLLLILIQMVGIAWAIHTSHPLFAQLIHQPLVPDLEISHQLLGEPALLANTLGSAVTLTLYLASGEPFRGALTGALLLGIYGATLSTDQVLSIAVLYSFAQAFLLLTLVHESYRMAFVDELTGLKGRRALNESMNKLGSQFVIAMLDVDHFKKFNDRFGHDAGDDVLRLLGSKLKSVGGGGKPFRYGGEEFTLLFSGLDAAGAKPHLEALRAAIAEKKFTLRRDGRRKKVKTGKKQGTNRTPGVKVTISIGFAERNDSNKTPESVLKAADKALYRAKRKGRNQVSR